MMTKKQRQLIEKMGYFPEGMSSTPAYSTPCKGICKRPEFQNLTRGFGKSRYTNGQKRCQICDCYMQIGDALRCPCCNYKLRSKPRNGKYKEQFHEATNTGANRI